ncbi:MAG TPA: RDD family protein [Cryptosporangiaceae bacterium]|nr:RDD family protein [Cryptosporangiaceae bacterium]
MTQAPYPPAGVPYQPVPPPAAGMGHPPAPGWGSGPNGGPNPVTPWALPSVPAGPPSGVATNGLPLAEATDRLLARMIDLLILLGPNLVVTAVFYGGAVWIGATSIGAPATGGELLLWVLLLLAAMLLALLANGVESSLYEVIYMRRHGGQTIGKRLRNIQVVALVDGSPATTEHLRRRWLAHHGVALLSAIPLVGSVVGIYTLLNQLWLLWDKPNRQCLHDKYAKTVVVVDAPGQLVEAPA